MATQPTVVTGVVTASGDITNAEARRIQELALVEMYEQYILSIMFTERDASHNFGIEIR